MNEYEACEYAAELLIKAGFILSYVSMKSEARYYKMPGHDDTIRVATHRSDKQLVGVFPGEVKARVTFTSSEGKHEGISHEHVEHITANAIGFYILRTASAIPYKVGAGRHKRRREEAIKVVAAPLEPTNEMLDAGRASTGVWLDIPALRGVELEREKFRIRYKAMIAARPCL